MKKLDKVEYQKIKVDKNRLINYNGFGRVVMK